MNYLQVVQDFIRTPAGSGLRGTQQESFRKQLAAGEVVWPTWWEVADAVNHMNYFGRVMSPEKMKD
ncbi:Uncharacterised protein [Xylophilus ampelinus]|nr:hypothetical protein [Variovorax sp.]VTY20862.1 Uncharacterised protein [Xylophilus ampelinus]